MAENRQTEKREELSQLSYDWALLGNAHIAGQYLAQGEEGVPFAKKGLELILSDAKVRDPWIVDTVSDPEVLHKTVANQLKTYNQYRAVQTVGDLVGRYRDDITKYLGSDAGVALKELDKFSKEKYSDVLAKIDKLNDVIKGKQFGRSTDEQVAEAEKEKEKYEKIRATIGLIEGVYIGRFRTRVEEEVTKDNLRALYNSNAEGKEKQK